MRPSSIMIEIDNDIQYANGHLASEVRLRRRKQVSTAHNDEMTDS